MTFKQNKHTEEYFFEEGCYITELWNENSDEKMSVAKARLPAGEKTRVHALRATTERYLILEGEGIVHIGSEQPHKVEKNDVVFIAPDTKQSIKNTGQQDLVFLAICTPRFKKENYREL